MRNRISVTHLDAYQYFLDTDMTEQELYQQLFGEYQPTIAMQAGTAWHNVLEHCESQSEPYQANSFNFDISQLNNHEQIIIGNPHEREQKHVWQGIQGVDLVGKIDVETPYFIIDHKLTANFDPERYINSWQWQAYLTMRNKQNFVYQVFECNEVKDNNIKIHNYHVLKLYAYNGMQQAVIDIVTELSELINKWRSQGLPCCRN